MKLILVVNDLLDNGGVPNEMRCWCNAMKSHCEIQVVTNKNKIKEANRDKLDKSIKVSTYTKYNVLKFINYSCENNDIIILCGFFNFYTIIFSLICRIRGIKYVLLPFSQITDEVLKRKMFVQNPDVVNLINYKKRKVSSFKSWFVWVSVFLKQLYFRLFNKLIVGGAYKVGVFSDFEYEQIIKLCKIDKLNRVNFHWGNNPKELKDSMSYEGFYDKKFKDKKDRINCIYWGRIDYYSKGIDVMINLVNTVVKKRPDLKFNFYLMGPDYNGGLELAQKEISKFNLNDSILLCGPDIFLSKDKIPLREADMSIYLSRWDGFPRTLRESIYFGIPVLVSKQTHFGDIVNDNNLGEVINDINDINELSIKLIRMLNRSELLKYKNNILKYRSNLNWDSVTKVFYGELYEY